MTIYSSAGAKFYIGTTLPTAHTITAYEALSSASWTEVGEISNLGDFGDEYNPITFSTLGRARMIKKKGTADAGTLATVVARDPSDAGQIALREALKSPNDFPFKIVLNDMPEDGANPSTIYFPGHVLSYRTSVGSADQITAASVNVAINDEPLEKVAA